MTGRRVAVVAAVVCALGSVAAPAKKASKPAPKLPDTSWAKLAAAARVAKIEEARKLKLGDRLTTLSEPFLGTPYVLSPLGEGSGRDPDPLIRYDAVDCLTMVEETIAMALAPDANDLLPTLNRVRYAGDEQRYEARNHLMEAQWLPNNVAHGFLKPVTRRYAGDATKRAVKVLTAKTWDEKGAKALALPKSVQSKGEFELDIVSADDALKAALEAPSGTVVVVVRADRPWLVTRVSHVAFLVQSNKGPMLRHASRSFARVVDEPLEQYLTRNLDYGAWTIEGLSFYEVVAP